MEKFNPQTDSFIMERNPLNNHWMVHSKHPNVVACYAFKRKVEAKQAVTDLNKELLEEAKQKGLTQ